MAVKTNLALFLGTDHQFLYTVQNGALTAGVDIAGWSLSWMVKKALNAADSAATVTKTTAVSGGIVITGTVDVDQVATVTVTDADTESLTAGTYFWELKRMGDGLETVLAYGQITLTRGVHIA